MLSQSTNSHAAPSSFPAALLPSQVTILAYGALLSEASSRLTFPLLQDFRHVRIDHMRRVFAHPHLFLISEGLVDPTETLRIASLSAEPCPDASFVAAAFTVDLDDTQRASFVAREPEYKITNVPFHELDNESKKESGVGVICTCSSDTELAFGPPPGVSSIWHVPETSGLLPADVYLRHCLLAVKKVGGQAETSFLHDTYLVDRKTTLAEYLAQEFEHVMASRPPPKYAIRFGG
jgi:hypothetical protein